MQTKIVGFTVFLLLIITITPAYAGVTSLSLEESSYGKLDNFKFIGEQEEAEVVHVKISGPNGKHITILSDPTPSKGEFDVIPKLVKDVFTSKGIYNATGFTDSQNERRGLTIQIEFDGNKIFEVPDFVLQLNEIADPTVDESETVSFTASVTDRSIDDVVYSLEKGPPSDATINSSTGKFVWTPSSLDGSLSGARYTFDVVATKGVQVDRETVTITVKEPAAVAPEPKPEPEPKTTPKSKELGLAPFVDESKDPQSYVDRYNSEDSYKTWFDDNYPEYSSIYEAVGLEEPLEVPAPFVDESKDPQSYVDRYNSEDSYKTWFDDNYPEYSSIYEAVGLEEPLEVPAPFVDESKDPQSYVDRYNSEDSYKTWFDDNYPEYSSIYEAVGLEEPKITESEFGECGEGTKLIGRECRIIAPTNEGGGCLIATAAYGSEMAPQVQFLREIRDNQLTNTASGASFMTGFNQVYYLFSPHVADLQRENPAFKEMVRIGITPLLSSLSIMSFAESDSQVLGYGIGVILLNIGIYFAAPVMLIYVIRKVGPVRF